MKIKIGDLVFHSSFQGSRLVRDIRKNKKGEFLIGIGTATVGWLMAKDCNKRGT